MTNQGKLYLVGTPIGNLKDITFRALEILGEVDLIAAEDTRHTRKLLSHYQINTPLISYHRHNAGQRAQEIVRRIASEGISVAVVSDAGMPGISDPGYAVVREAVDNGVGISPIPGPSAALAALVVSGLPAEQFLFAGFLPRNKEERKQALAVLAEQPATIIIYEAPHRIKETMAACVQAFGADRPAVVAREITKKFEEVLRGTLAALAACLNEKEIRGEFCLVIGGRVKGEQSREWWQELTTEEHLNLLISRGFSPNDAIKEAARTRGAPKREVYAVYHRLEQ